MLDDLSTRVDATDNRLTRANKRMKEFIRKNEGGDRYTTLVRRKLIITPLPKQKRIRRGAL